MVGWHYWLNGHESEQAPGDSEEQRSLQAAVHGVAKSWTWPSNWTTVEPYTLDEWIVWYVSSLKKLSPQKKKITGKTVKASLERTFVGLPFPKWLDKLRINSSIHVCEWASKCLLSHVSLFATPWTVPTGLLCLSNSPGKNTGVGCHFPLHNTYMIMPK